MFRPENVRTSLAAGRGTARPHRARHLRARGAAARAPGAARAADPRHGRPFGAERLARRGPRHQFPPDGRHAARESPRGADAGGRRGLRRAAPRSWPPSSTPNWRRESSARRRQRPRITRQRNADGSAGFFGAARRTSSAAPPKRRMRADPKTRSRRGATPRTLHRATIACARPRAARSRKVVGSLVGRHGGMWGTRELIASIATDLACNDYWQRGNRAADRSAGWSRRRATKAIDCCRRRRGR